MINYEFNQFGENFTSLNDHFDTICQWAPAQILKFSCQELLENVYNIRDMK